LQLSQLKRSTLRQFDRLRKFNRGTITCSSMSAYSWRDDLVPEEQSETDSKIDRKSIVDGTDKCSEDEEEFSDIDCA
jgi:hypothetical protein